MLVVAGMSVLAGMAADHARCPVAVHSGLPHAGDLGCLGMSRKRSPLLVQVLLFLLVTLLGVATGNLTKNPGALPWGLEILRRESLPLAGITVLVIIGMMVWQHRTEELLALPVVGGWDSDRSPFPGLEAFTERDSAVFFGRDAEITELLDRLHPVVTARANRLVEVIEQPARRAGLTFDPPTLPQRMAADAYQRIDGVAGVLTRQADKVAAELGGAAGPVLRRSSPPGC